MRYSIFLSIALSSAILQAKHSLSFIIPNSPLPEKFYDCPRCRRAERRGPLKKPIPAIKHPNRQKFNPGN